MDTIIPFKQTVSEHLSEHHISKNTDFTWPLIILLSGIVLLAVPLPKSFTGETVPLIKWFLGLTVISIGVYKYFKRPAYRYQKTGKLIKYKIINFDSQDENYVVNCLKNKPVAPGHVLSNGNTANLLLKVYVERDGNFFAAQLLKYTLYSSYEIVTETCFFHGDDARRISKALIR